MDTDYCIVYCTCPSHQIAEKIARQLIKSRLAACINIVHHVTSFYVWQEEMREGTEAMMIIKTKKDHLDDLDKLICHLHPYEFPEFIATPITKGNATYLAWLDEVVK